jgi:hypothetical protein
MQEKAKISLSALEYQLVTDETFILTKNSIIQKVYDLFGSMSVQYENILAKNHSQTLDFNAPKISKGENYKGLPYVMLDHPKFFSRNNVLAIRSFFWWGRYFSCTLHVKGIYKEQGMKNIDIALRQQQLKHVLISDGVDEWNHDVSEGYLPIENMYSLMDAMPFIKLVMTHSINEWVTAEEFFTETFQLYVQLLNDQLPRR